MMGDREMASWRPEPEPRWPMQAYAWLTLALAFVTWAAVAVFVLRWPGLKALLP